MKERLGKGKVMRNALRAAIAAATLASAAPETHAQGLTPYDVGGVERTDSDIPKPKKRTPEIAESWVSEKAGTADYKEAKLADERVMAEYLQLRERLEGIHIRFSGKEVYWEQYEKFCEELSIFCDHFVRPSHVEQETEMSPETYARISETNRAVAKKVFPVEDRKLYGISEKWTIPDVAGDCEDAVLLKMVRLIDAGIDPSRLHILVVRRKDTQEGHAVLAVDAPVSGKWNTLILDNLSDEILPIEEMEKKYSGVYSSFVSDKAGERKVRFFEYEKAAQ
jgi:predicted transglutaminase-like cysteine proteinase